MLNLNTSLCDPDSGETNTEFIDQVCEEFAATPEAQALVEQFGNRGWVGLMLEYAGSHIGTTVAGMSLRDFREIVFGLFPRKVSTDADSADSIIAELRSFWNFIHRQYGRSNANQIANSLTETAVAELRRALADPSNYGMAKSFFMKGKQAGFDMTTQAGLDSFMAQYNRQLLENPPVTARAPRPPLRPDQIQILPPSTGSSKGNDRDKKRMARKAQKEARRRNRRK